MKAILNLILITTLLIGCKRATNELIQIKDEDGKVVEEYYVRKKDQVKEGVYRIFTDGKLFETGTYVNGVQTGIRQFFYENGKLQMEQHFEEGKLKGVHRAYFPDGTLKAEGIYSDSSQMTGYWKYYYPSGQLKEKVFFQNSVEHGPFVEYFENGQKKYEGSYIPMKIGSIEEGVEQGELLQYNEAGKLIYKKICENGICRTIWKAEETVGE